MNKAIFSGLRPAVFSTHYVKKISVYDWIYWIVQGADIGLSHPQIEGVTILCPHPVDFFKEKHKFFKKIAVNRK